MFLLNWAGLVLSGADYMRAKIGARFGTSRWLEVPQCGKTQCLEYVVGSVPVPVVPPVVVDVPAEVPRAGVWGQDDEEMPEAGASPPGDEGACSNVHGASPKSEGACSTASKEELDEELDKAQSEDTDRMTRLMKKKAFHFLIQSVFQSRALAR